VVNDSTPLYGQYVLTEIIKIRFMKKSKILNLAITISKYAIKQLPIVYVEIIVGPWFWWRCLACSPTSSKDHGTTMISPYTVSNP